ncbi:hypothetical protein SBADM41S_08096 [Streptomyces badius]
MTIGLFQARLGRPPSEPRQAVGHQAELRGAVVQLQQIAEHLFAVTFLHAAQIGEHAARRTWPGRQAERLGGRGLRGEGAAFAERELPEDGLDGGAQQGLFREVRLGQHCAGTGLGPHEAGAATPGRVSWVKRSTSEVRACSSSRSRAFSLSLPSSSWNRTVLSVRRAAVCCSCSLDGGREGVQQLPLALPARQRDAAEGFSGRYSAPRTDQEQCGERHVGGVGGVRFERGQRGLEPFGLGGPGRGRPLGPDGEGVRDGEGGGQDDPAGDHHRRRPAARSGRSQDHGHGSGDGEHGQHGHKQGALAVPGAFVGLRR